MALLKQQEQIKLEIKEEKNQSSQDLEYFKKLLQKQQLDIEDLLKEQKQELIEKVDPEKKHTFRQRNLAKQHEVNLSFQNLTKKARKALEKNQPEVTSEFVYKLLRRT